MMAPILTLSTSGTRKVGRVGVQCVVRVSTDNERRKRRWRLWRLSMAQQLLCALVLILISLTGFSLGLRDVRITIPIAVKKGDNANLICNYDMEGDTLYTVKWYKGRREFYRYTPKENPAIKVFTQSQTGIQIEENMSNGSHIVVLSLDTPLSGKYSCEVSADAPSFHTTIVSAEMEVVETPEQRPSITGIQPRYRIGEVIKGNCSSVHSRPAANLTWTINDIPVPNSVDSKITKNADNSESSTIGLYYVVTHHTFARGKVKLRCYATIFNVYKAFTDKVVEEVIPRILATGHNGAANLMQTGPFDESSNGLLPDHQMDEHGMQVQRNHDSYLQQQYNDKPAMSSAAPSTMNPFTRGALVNWGHRKWSSAGGALLLLVVVQQLGHCHRKRNIVRAIISHYLIIVAALMISAIVARIRC